MEVFIKILQFLLSLSLLIIIHELGHFIPARLFKTRVEKFYLFFDPWFSIFKKKKGDTEFGIGWLPLGGYVKISGMIDESMDKEQMKQPAQPWEFRSKPAWQRLIIMLGGVTFNILLAVLIYIFMLTIIGESYLPAKNVKYGVEAGTLAQEIGIQNGDKIIKIDGQAIDDYFDITRTLILGDVSTLTVERQQQEVTLQVPQDFYARLVANRGRDFISLRIPFIVEDFSAESVARDAGIQKGDHIIGINETETWSFDAFRARVVDYAGQETQIMVLRDGQTLIFPITLPETPMLGVFVKPIDKMLEFQTHHYSFFAAIPAGASKAWKTTVGYISEIRMLFKPEIKATESLGGFITIGSIFAPTWDWVHFWTITALLSVVLAIMNILPIPALDGGHVMFLMYEIITRRKPHEKFMEYAQLVGMILLFSLLLFANFNDVLRLFK